MPSCSFDRAGAFGLALLVPLLFVFEVSAQLVWNQQMEDYSAILPLTLDNTVYRIRAKPPGGVEPADIHCDIGITGTVLTDTRGTYAGNPAEKVLGGLMNYDDIDVQFTDRVDTGARTYRNRIVEKYDFDCGINIKYETKKNIAQVEIRVGYVLPSGDIEGLTWHKLNRKERILNRNIRKCDQCKRDIADLEGAINTLSASASNPVQRGVNNQIISGNRRKISRMQKFISNEEDFRRDLAAFRSIREYLKTKVNGTQVFVHFHHDGETIPVDIGELKRARVRPIQVFAHADDPIKKVADGRAE